jgi:opacity protein-like surface antigen
MRYSRLVLGAAMLCLLGAAASAQSLVAQNTDSAGTVASQDSILNPQDQYIADGELAAKQAEVRAAETNLNINFGAMHTQYHENLNPGDDENGFTGGGGVGASILAPERGLFLGADLYSALFLNLSAGNIAYGGHYLFSGLPVDATDRAVFINVEGRLGLGFPLIGGAEFIPFLTGGYQDWNRNIDLQGAIGTDEQYTAGLLGGGVKLDIPVGPTVVLSGTAEISALFAGHIVANGAGFSHGLGGSAEERLIFGADDDLHGPFHVFATADWEHFNYAGSKPGLNTYYFYEPLSTTTQFGVNVGAAYSF